jgi:hypothetical protein
MAKGEPAFPRNGHRELTRKEYESLRQKLTEASCAVSEDCRGRTHLEFSLSRSMGSPFAA